MKIAFVVGDISSTGGIERVMSILSDSFVKHGHEVNIVSFFRAHEKLSYRFNSSVKIITLSCYEYATKKQGGWSRLNMFLKIIPRARAFFRENKFDIVLGAGFPVNATLFFAGNRARTIVCEHTIYNYYSIFIRIIRIYLYKKFLGVVVLTQNDKKRFDRYLKNTFVIPNPSAFEINQVSSLSSPKMISVGRLEKEKGYDTLLRILPDVFRAFPQWKLDIWGDGILKNTLLKLRDDLYLQEHVNFCGVTDNIIQEYLSSSLYVMSSIYEGFGMVLVEAAACGLPIISFDCPEGPADILKDDGGILVSPRDTSGLKNAIINMLSNQELRNYYAAKGPDIAKRYSPENIYPQWEQLLKNLLPDYK